MCPAAASFYPHKSCACNFDFGGRGESVEPRGSKFLCSSDFQCWCLLQSLCGNLVFSPKLFRALPVTF